MRPSLLRWAKAKDIEMKLINEICRVLLACCRRIYAVLNRCACNAYVVAEAGVDFTGTARVCNGLKQPDAIRLGRKVMVEGELYIFKHGGSIEIGEFSYVGKGTLIRSGESIKIGRHVLVSHGVNIFDTNSHEVNFEERAEQYMIALDSGQNPEKGSVETAPVVIDDHVWISFGVTILKGIHVGEGAIIAANSVVTKDVPPFTLVAGNPAKCVKTL